MSTSHPLPLTPAGRNPLSRRLFWLSLVLIVAATAILPMDLVIAWQLRAWQLVIGAASLVVLDGLAIAAIRFSRRGREDIAPGHLIGGMLLVVLVSAIFLARLGLIVGLAGLLMTVGIAVQTLPTQRGVNRAVILGLLVGLVAGLLEIAAPPFQVQVRSLQAAVPVMTVIVLGLAGAFIAATFRTYSLSNKLIVAFLTVAGLSVGLVAFADNLFIQVRFTALVGQSVELAAALTAALQVSLLAAIAALFISGIAALIVSQMLAQPITHLTTVAQQVQGGDLNVEAQIETRDEIGALAAAFNTMTAQLRQTLADLEVRVAERTRAVETSAQISRRLSTLLEVRDVVAEVVEQLRAAYDYYHVHIYLFDETREMLVLAGGTGEAGRALLARGHHLAAGHGLVGRAADTNTVVLASDVTQMAGWLPNPLLPDTKSEVAVPIALGGHVLGVLDVQQNAVGALKAADADLIQSVAQQTAIALQNARSYQQAQREAATEAALREVTQKIQNTTTAPAALQIAVRELGRAASARQVRVRLNVAAGPADATGGGKHI